MSHFSALTYCEASKTRLIENWRMDHRVGCSRLTMAAPINGEPLLGAIGRKQQGGFAFGSALP